MRLTLLLRLWHIDHTQDDKYAQSDYQSRVQTTKWRNLIKRKWGPWRDLQKHDTTATRISCPHEGLKLLVYEALSYCVWTRPLHASHASRVSRISCLTHLVTRPLHASRVACGVDTHLVSARRPLHASRVASRPRHVSRVRYAHLVSTRRNGGTSLILFCFGCKASHSMYI